MASKIFNKVALFNLLNIYRVRIQKTCLGVQEYQEASLLEN